jgi:Cof subfamily protein (haloacid dehalogenase superfamily)
MYKLVAIDLDGTLLNAEKEVSERNKKAIELAIEKGVRIVICSGRVFTGARLYAKQVGSIDPVIACNGAIISENIDGKVLYSNVMRIDDCLRVIDICRKNDIYFHVYAGDVMMTEKLGFTSLKYFEKNKMLPPEDRVQIEIVSDIAEKVKEVKDKVSKVVVVNNDIELLGRTRGEIVQMEGIDVMSSNFDNFEVMNKGVNKGAALKKLSEILGIAPSEMIAIGDNENDISMLKYAGMGVAMGNGEDIAKEVSQYITASNDNDGVAQAIERFVLDN